MHNRITTFFIFLAWLFVASTANAAELSASVDRNQISINETLTFQLRYEDQIDSSQLNLDILQQDFEVLGVRPQSSSNVSILNGQVNRQALTMWTITLAPRRQGTLVIPSFNIKGDVSNAIRIEVTDATASRPQDSPMLVSLETDISEAYVGQQILVQVELLAQDRVSNLSGEQLRLDNVQLELLDQKSYRRVENGISWQVVEWQYALIPEQAGTLNLPPQLFSGIINASNYRDPWSTNFNRGQRISARSPAKTVEIKPAPETNGLTWFPAANVGIQSLWSGDTSQMRVGEPITRTIEIVAQGQKASAIPPLPESSSLTYKTYKDQPQLDNQLTALGIVGLRRESQAIVPSAEGLLELPEEQVSWWNTETRTWEEAVLPAETFQVLPAVNAGFAPPSTPRVFLPEDVTSTEPATTVTNPGWQIATVILALIAAFQFWLLFTRRPVKSSPDASTTTNESEKAAWRALNRTLKSGQPAEIRAAILNWNRAILPQQRVYNLENLARNSGSKALADLFRELDQCLYKGDGKPDTVQLGSELESLRQLLTAEPERQQGLNPLYPA